MKRVSAIVLMAMMVCGILAAAQMPEARKPGAEEKNLAYFAGDWKLDGNLKPGPMGPGGKFTGSEHDEWMPGGFFLVSHSQGSSAMGEETGLAIMGYDPEKKVYTYDAYNNRGEAEHATGTFDGTTWTWNSNMTMGGKTLKGRFVLRQNSAATYTFKFDMSEDGNNWMNIMEGRGTKGKAGTAKKE